MWTTENRGRYDRDRLRYPSDLTDEEWKLVEPLIAAWKGRGGEGASVDIRERVMGAVVERAHVAQRGVQAFWGQYRQRRARVARSNRRARSRGLRRGEIVVPVV